MTRIALLVLLLAACGKDNPHFCDDACQMMMDADVGPNGCASSDDCSGATPVCNTTDSECVACTAADNGSCGNMLCSSTNECRRCVSHDQCTASDACNASTGECIDTSMVAYVATIGTNSNPCTKDLPCATLTHAAMQKPFVKLQNNIAETVVFNNVTVTVLAEPQTQIARLSGNDSAILTVSGTSNVVLTDVVITGGTTATGHGIFVASGAAGVSLTLEDVMVYANSGLGLSFGGGTLTMSRSTVAGNNVGGVDITANFEITNSLFIGNGDNLGSQIGGLRLLPGNIKGVFSFNTVANNEAQNALVAGINCSVPMTITTTILSNNATNGCMFNSSLFDPTSTHVGSNSNITGAPAFKNTSMPFAADFFRINSTSAAIDVAQGAAAVMFDIDGDVRPQNGVRDIGADEYK